METEKRGPGDKVGAMPEPVTRTRIPWGLVLTIGLLALVQYYKLSGNDGPLGMPVYVGGSIEAGNAWTDIDDAFGTFVIAGSVFVGLDTPAGPLYVAGGFAEGGDQALYVFLGPIF